MINPLIPSFVSLGPSHHTGLPCILPHTSPVTMLAELHPSLPIDPLSPGNPADRALPHIRRNPCAPGNLHGSRQRDRCRLLRLHRRVVT